MYSEDEIQDQVREESIRKSLLGVDPGTTPQSPDAPKFRCFKCRSADHIKVHEDGKNYSCGNCAYDSRFTRMSLRRETPKVGRNESCPCGSGKKYKYCCLGKLSQRYNWKRRSQ